VPEPSTIEVEMAIEEPKRHKSQGIDKIPAELIKTGSRTIYSEIHELTNSIHFHFIFTNLCTCISVNINANTLKY